MYDHSLFLRTLSEFSVKLLSSYDIDIVLQDLMERLRVVLVLDGAGVAVVQDGRLEFATAVPPRLAELEKTQLEHQSAPAWPPTSPVKLSPSPTSRPNATAGPVLRCG